MSTLVVTMDLLAASHNQTGTGWAFELFVSL